MIWQVKYFTQRDGIMAFSLKRLQRHLKILKFIKMAFIIG